MSEIRKSMTAMQTATNGHWPQARMVPRNVVTVLFRHRWLILLSFFGIFAVAVAASMLWGDRYQARMLILVENNERLNPAIDGQQPSQAIVDRNGVTVEQLNSEIALLRSQDLLQDVVQQCGLTARPGIFSRLLFRYAHPSPAERQAEAVRQLARKLQIQVLRMSDMIEVSYRSSSPQQAASVLSRLSKLYLEKHAAVHRPPGVADFFAQETQKYQDRLAADEAQLVKYTQANGVVAAQVQMDSSLQKLSEFQAMQKENQASLVADARRIRALESQLGVTSPRMTTQVKTSDNAVLLQNLQSTLLNLRIKRTDLLEKYKPTYRPVIEVERQIKQTQEAIASAQKSPWHTTTTDEDPVFMQDREDLARARASLAADQARGGALGQAIHGYLQQADWLQQQGMVQQNLMRNYQTDETNYLLNLRKGEEARISDALDARRILNVSVAEQPNAPALPMHSGLWYVTLSGFLAGLGSLGLAFVSDALDPTVRTPDEAEWALQAPVLAALPGNFDRKKDSRVW